MDIDWDDDDGFINCISVGPGLFKMRNRKHDDTSYVMPVLGLVGQEAHNAVPDLAKILSDAIVVTDSDEGYEIFFNRLNVTNHA